MPGRGCIAPATWCAGPATGTLDYVGRADTQIKLRGQRIELGEIENTLLACPQVTQAAATVHHSATGAHLVAYITLEHTATADDDAEIVEEWQHLYDDLYGAEVEAPGFGMDFRGWNSSYTGEPIPLEEMVEWRSATVDRIMALQPRRVLEIGVGSGLLLSQIAPECDAVCRHRLFGGGDRDPAIGWWLGSPWRDRVRLRAQPAHVSRGAAAGPLRHHHAQLGHPVLPQRGISGRGHRQRHGAAGPRRGAVYRRRA